MKNKPILLFSLFLLLAMLLSGCSGVMSASSWSGLSVDAETAFLAGGQFVYAIDLANGLQVWKYPVKGDAKKVFFAPPLKTPDGQLIIGSGGNNHSLISLNPQSGNPPSENWVFDAAADRWVASPLVWNEIIYAPNGDGHLYALDMKGNLLWSVKLGGQLWTTPATDGELLYVPSLDHRLYAVNPETHAVAWIVELNGAVMGAPVVASDNKLYVGSFASRVEVIDTVEKTVSDLLETRGWVWGAPVLDEEMLYFGDLEGNFYAFDISGGELSYPAIKPDDAIVGSPLVLSDNVVVTTESGNLYFIDSKGKYRSQIVDGKIYSAPVLAGELLLVAPSESETLLFAYDLEGKQEWVFTPAKEK
ncbi:MAG: PQQ-binding-like beta-propeller repeat protein [Anaerolineales bacterium]|nr:PQQ-binding-like beta-propeller repeat protein [Anaerolineales bacterium]